MITQSDLLQVQRFIYFNSAENTILYYIPLEIRYKFLKINCKISSTLWPSNKEKLVYISLKNNATIEY